MSNVTAYTIILVGGFAAATVLAVNDHVLLAIIVLIMAYCIEFRPQKPSK